jgi:hypothetical protein
MLPDTLIRKYLRSWHFYTQALSTGLAAIFYLETFGGLQPKAPILPLALAIAAGLISLHVIIAVVVHPKKFPHISWYMTTWVLYYLYENLIIGGAAGYIYTRILHEPPIMPVLWFLITLATIWPSIWRWHQYQLHQQGNDFTSS